MRRSPSSKDSRAFHIQREQRFDRIKGQEAITLTGLYPAGRILLCGRPVAAICRDLSIPSGAKVRIIDQSFDYLVVELVENQSQN